MVAFSYFFWFIAAVIFSTFLLIMAAYKITSRYLIIGISLIMISFMGFSVKTRLDFFSPVESTPNSKLSFIYQHHKLKADEQEYFVILWLTRVDNYEEVIYIFPYLGNEILKEELDKLRKMILEKKLSSGPYEFPGDITKDGTMISEGYLKITRKKQTYQNLMKGIEQ